MNFSLVLPSRERVPLLRRFLDSIESTTYDLTQCEVLVAIDQDDNDTVRACRELGKHYRFARFIVGSRPDNLSKIYNGLASNSCGRFVQMCNDDIEFKTAGWDDAALPVLNEFYLNHSDGIFLGQPHDDTGCPYSCFPLLSKETITALGYLQPEFFGGWGVDVFYSRVFGLVGRELPLPYKIHHACQHNGTRRRDRVNRRVSSMSKYPYHLAGQVAEKLKNFLR